MDLKGVLPAIVQGTWVKIAILNWVILLCINVAGEAQPVQDGPGLQFGNVSNFAGKQPDNLMVRLFYRNQITTSLSGETGIGLARIHTPYYKTRLIPLEYRFQYMPRGIIQQWQPGTAVIYLQPFIYAGVGAHLYYPVAIPSDGDPLTEEMGPAQPASSLWGYEAGIAPSAAIGIGTDIRVSPEVSFVINAGYNQSFTNHMSGVEAAGNDGYWGISVGMQFNRSQPEAVAPIAITRTPRVPVQLKLKPASVATAGTMPVFHFGLMGYDVSPFKMELEVAASQIKNRPGQSLTIHGHTDQIGMERINRTLAQDRAYLIAVELMRKGVEPGQLYIAAHADQYPWVNLEETKLNRRVELEWGRFGEPLIFENRAEVPAETPLPMVNNEIGFMWAGGMLREESLESTESLMAYLAENEGVTVGLYQQPEANKSEELRSYLIEARMRTMQRMAIGYGVDPDRIRLITREQLFGEYPEAEEAGREGQVNIVMELD